MIVGDEPTDYFGSKAVYLGEELPKGALPQHSIHINATILPSVNATANWRISEKTHQCIQNELLEYRIRNRTVVNNSGFNARGLPLDSGVVASVFGNCIVDAPSVEAELDSILAPHALQQEADRSETLESLTVNAAFFRCHQGKAEVMVKEVTEDVNRDVTARGGKLQYSPEKVGRTLKKVGLFSRRLGSQGNGLRMDEETLHRIHDVATAYRNRESQSFDLTCPLCRAMSEPQEVM